MNVDRRSVAADAPIWTPPLVSLAVLAALLLWFPLLRATTPSAIAYNEGWNTYWQQAAADGQQLYGAPPGLTIENYPPLSFHLIGWLGHVTGDTNVAGRVVALLSLGLVCTLAGRITTRISGSRFAGWYAGLYPLVWLGVYAPDRIAMNDPQFLGMVPELLGFSIYARWPRSAPALSGSAVLFALAVFTKQNLIAYPAAVGIDMLLARDWKSLCVWTTIGLVAAGLLFGASIWIDGGFFLDHLLRSRAAAYGTGRNTDLGYFLVSAPAIFVSASWVIGLVDIHRSRLLAAGWAVSTGVGMILAFGHGVAYNILFEAMVLNAILVPTACQELIGGAGPRGRMICVCLLMLNVIWMPALIPGGLTNGFHAWEGLPRAKMAFTSEVDLIRGRPGTAWCEDLLLCRAAGKPMVFDAYVVQDQIETGRLSECDILHQLVTQGPVTVEIGAPPAPTPPLPKARLRFTARFMRTLLTYYRPILRTPDVTIFVPSFGPWEEAEACR
ncbi:MAG TPA: hypothetical protein VGM42_11420 [Rhodopila sp.]|jgi:hypothetical protein